MSKKLTILFLLALMLSGCGASADSAEPMEEYAQTPQSASSVDGNGSSVYGGGSETMAPAGIESYDIAESTGEVQRAEKTVSDARYFIFDRKTNQVYNDEGTALLYEHYCATTFDSADQELDGWVGSVLDQIQRDYTSNSRNLTQYAQETLELSEVEDFYSYSNYQELGVARHDERFASLLSLSYVYSGGTHPNAVQTAYNLDMEKCVMLTLEDVIFEGSAGALGEMVYDQVTAKFQQLGEYALFEDYPTTIANSMEYGNMTAYWYLNDTGMVIFYNQYMLGPYAAGIISVEIPYADLEGILKEEYFPAEYEDIPGDLVLRGDWEGYHKIPITIQAEGERLLVGVEGQVYQIQISEIYWLEGTPIMQQMLFSASELTQMDVLEIIGGFQDETRSFAIQFTNGSGETAVYYVHGDGLSTEP